jgi:hypothetical protein
LEETEVQEVTTSPETVSESGHAPKPAPRRRTTRAKAAPPPEDTVDVIAAVAESEASAPKQAELPNDGAASSEEKPRRERTFKRSPRSQPSESEEAPATEANQDAPDARKENRDAENRGGDRQDQQPRNERRWRERENRGGNDRSGNDRGERRWGNRDRDREQDESVERDERPNRSNMAPLNIAEMEQKTREQLAELAIAMGLEEATVLRKTDLIFRLLQAQAEVRGNVFSGGFPQFRRAYLLVPD